MVELVTINTAKKGKITSPEVLEFVFQASTSEQKIRNQYFGQIRAGPEHGQLSAVI